jgi:hypothetical protein
LPNTYNRKDLANPILVEIETLDTSRVYNPSDIEEALNIEGCPPKDEPEKPAGEDPTFEIPEVIPHAARILIGTQPKIRDLFHGVGKSPFDRNGAQQDGSSSGYDSSLLCALIKKGITDPAALAAVLWNRPDGVARKKGQDYIRRTVRKALGFMSDKDTKPKLDVTVERIRRFDQTPARYELTVDGKTITVGTADLLGRKKFMTIFMDHYARVPTLPDKDDWLTWVDDLLRRAELIPMPPEASEDPALRATIVATIDNLQEGEGLDGLDNDKVVVVPSGEHAGRSAFTLDAVLHRLKEDFPTVQRGDVSVHMRRLGITDAQITIDHRRRRVWLKRPEDARGENGAAA